MLTRLIIFISLLIISGCATLPKHYVSLNTGADLNFNEVLTEIESSKAVFVGELHATPRHHKVQLEVIKHLHNAGRKVAIAFEMLPVSHQDVLDGWINGSITESMFTRVYQSYVNLPFRYYRNIFLFARNAGIPIFGINAKKELIANVSRNGLDVVPGELLETISFTSCSQDSEYMNFIGLSVSREYHVSEMPYLCDAQRVRDAVMAYNVSKLMVDRNYTVIVLTGVLHAAKLAVPEMLKNYTTLPYKVLMPRKVSHIVNRGPDLKIADYLWY
jgi:uncharacterized iron-regulated protein